MDKREKLLRLLERMSVEYGEIPAAIVVIGALGAAVNEGLEVELAQWVWPWMDARIRPLVEASTVATESNAPGWRQVGVDGDDPIYSTPVRDDVEPEQGDLAPRGTSDER